MLAWTPGGAVPRPRTLQIRLDALWPDRLPAGAPTPSRALTTEEVMENLRWFTAQSPRGLPVDALVLSGAHVATRADLAEIVEKARSWGVARVTLHAGADDLPFFGVVPGVDRCVVPVREHALDRAFAALRAARVAIDANVPLTPHAKLAEIADYLAKAAVDSCTFTWPFPAPSAVAPPLAETRVALGPAVATLDAAGIPVTIKGLPACWLGSLAGRVRRSRNRWYVDAEHQKDAAILFFPAVVAFAKTDSCRFCPADADCDGYFPVWAGPGSPPIRPL